MVSLVAALKTGSLLAGFVAGALVGAAVAAVVAAFSFFLQQHQVAVGFVLTLMIRDMAYFIGNPYSRIQGPHTAPMAIPALDQLPFLGPEPFNHNLPVYLIMSFAQNESVRRWTENRPRFRIFLRFFSGLAPAALGKPYRAD